MRRFVVGLCVLLASSACSSGARPAARHSSTSTPSATTTPSNAASSSPTPSPTPPRTPQRSATPTRTVTKTPAKPTTIYIPPPDAGTYTAPVFVSAKVDGCDYLGKNTWRVRYSVTVRGGENWQFYDTTSRAMPNGAEIVGSRTGAGGTVIGSYRFPVQWVSNPDGGGVPDKFDETIIWYAIHDTPHFKTYDKKLPAQYQQKAHCTR